jgi:hypothetical protein
MSAASGFRFRSEWSPSTKSSVTGPGMASVSRLHLGRGTEGVPPAGDEEARQAQVGEVLGPQSVGPSGRVERIADQNQCGHLQALGHGH